MDWRELFSKSLIDTAQGFVDCGKVKKPEWEDGLLTLRVRDDKNYKTSVDVDIDGYLIGLSCNCDDGRVRKPCVHMAASLIYSEEITGERVLYDEIGMTDSEKLALPLFNIDHGSETKKKEKAAVKGSGNKPKLIDDISELQESIENSRKLQFPDARYVADDGYRYFNYKEIGGNLEYSSGILRKAKQLAENSEVNISFETGYEENTTGPCEMVGRAKIKGTVHNGPMYSDWGAILIFSGSRMHKALCDTWGCQRYRYGSDKLKCNVCEHSLAAYLRLEDFLKDHDVGDSTNYQGHRFIDYVAGNFRGNDEKLEKDIKIEPVINIPESGYVNMYLTFRTGVDKMYVIKDLTEFVDDINARNEYTLGKNVVIKLDRNRLTEKAAKWFDFINGNNDDLQRAGRIANDIRRGNTRYGYRDYLYTLGKEIYLRGDTLDDFFECGMGEVIAVKDKSEGLNSSYELQLTEDKLPLELTIVKHMDTATGKLKGIILTGDSPETFSGDKYTYFKDTGRLVRIVSEDNGLLMSLLETEQGGYIRMQIGRKLLRDFYDKSLPALRKIAKVVEPDRDEIAKYIPPEPEFAFFFDAYDGVVMCRADVYYGNDRYCATDAIEYWAKPNNEYSSRRSLEKETKVCNLLHEYMSSYDPNRKLMFCEKDDEVVFRLLDHGIAELEEYGSVYSTDRFKRLIIRRDVKFSMGVSVESNIMNLEITSDELSREELLEIFYAYKRKQSFIRLKSGDFVKLDEGSNLAMLNESMESMGVSLKEFVKGRMHIPAYRAFYLDKALEKMQGIFADRDKYYKELIRDFSSIGNSDFELPSELKHVMRNYQQTGYKWLRTLDRYGFGGILADDMGLGKTLQVISVIKAICDGVDRDSQKPALVICPASLVYNWREELRKFAPNLISVLVIGTQDERHHLINRYMEADVLVTSYDLLKRDIDSYDGKRFRFQIIDEAQYIKNHNTEAAKTVKVIEADTKLALTGTPIENRLSELWSIFDYLMPGMLYSYSDFRSKFETPIVKNNDKEAGERLRRMVHPFILRRIKSDVLKDLPDKLEEIRYAGMDSSQQKLYDAQVVRIIKKINEKDDEQFNRSKIEILAELTRIRQICCDPSLCFEDYKGGSAKREVFMDMIRSLNEAEHKTLVFSQFTSMLALLQSDLDKEGISYYKITGETSKEERIRLVNAFNQDATPVFLISLKAGGTGLNLTGADSVIHYDPWWNVAVQNQATDRAHRIGQTKEVTEYKLIIKDTIEEKILEMQNQKKKLADDILSGENISSTTLTREDLIMLLS